VNFENSLITVDAATRACLSGEDLDWLGYRSVCVALDLSTVLEIGDRHGESDDGFLPLELGHATLQEEVWQFLTKRFSVPARRPPEVRARWSAPVAGGLSSSTSLTIALFRAFLEYLGRRDEVSADTIARWALEVELPFDGGGGMDHLSIVQGGCILTVGRDGELPELKAWEPLPEGWAILVLDSGVKKSTLEHTSSVRSQVAANDPSLKRYIDLCDEASAQVWSGIARQSLPEVWSGMSAAHNAMRDIQNMSTPFLEALRRTALDSVGIAFKISGSGGGGALVAVCHRDDVDRLERLQRELAERHPATSVSAVNALAPARPQI